jgi:Zn-finger nucleic acid-binding protein
MRDQFATCPRCQIALDPAPERSICTQCQGVMLSEATVSQLIADMIGDQVSQFGWQGKIAEPQPLVLEPRASASSEALTCPHCATAMEPRDLYGIAVDRCPAHGIWFDRQELADALARAYTAGQGRITPGEKLFMRVVMAGALAAWVLRIIAV